MSDKANLVKVIAENSHNWSMKTGMPGIEVAGHVLSFLSANPDQIERYISEGNELFIDGTITFFNGCLSFACVDGKVRTADQVRQIRKGAH